MFHSVSPLLTTYLWPVYTLASVLAWATRTPAHTATKMRSRKTTKRRRPARRRRRSWRRPARLLGRRPAPRDATRGTAPLPPARLSRTRAHLRTSRRWRGTTPLSSLPRVRQRAQRRRAAPSARGAHVSAGRAHREPAPAGAAPRRSDRPRGAGRRPSSRAGRRQLRRRRLAGLLRFVV